MTTAAVVSERESMKRHLKTVIESRLSIKTDPKEFVWNKACWNYNLYGITLWTSKVGGGGCHLSAQTGASTEKQLFGSKYVGDVSSIRDLAPFFDIERFLND